MRLLTINYDPEDVHNPRLQRHYAELEALALERAVAEEVHDETRRFASHSIGAVCN